jgi:hypothetical protein
MFGRLKDWRRVATRYDRCPTVFLSAVALAATVMFGLWVLTLVSSHFFTGFMQRIAQQVIAFHSQQLRQHFDGCAGSLR